MPPTPTQTRSLPPLDAFKKGFNFADWKDFDSQYRGLYKPPVTDQALRNLAATGANWISLVVVVGQETVASTTIFRKPPATATESELLHVIDLAHNLGMRVMLNPHLDLSNDPAHWRGQIGTAFNSEAQWQIWFASYREFINYYAAFAQDAGVDMFSIGHELDGTTQREDDWRRIIREVRQRFRSPITYASNWGGNEKRITWWDAVDFIGVEAYYPLTNKNNPSVEELKATWTEKGCIALLESLSTRFRKPIIFTQLGYRSIDGTNKNPGTWRNDAPLDMQEQADCYQAAFEVFWGKPWLAGIFWWQWFADTSRGGLNNKDFTPYGKPAEEVLKKFYLSQ